MSRLIVDVYRPVLHQSRGRSGASQDRHKVNRATQVQSAVQGHSALHPGRMLACYSTMMKALADENAEAESEQFRAYQYTPFTRSRVLHACPLAGARPVQRYANGKSRMVRQKHWTITRRSGWFHTALVTCERMGMPRDYRFSPMNWSFAKRTRSANHVF